MDSVPTNRAKSRRRIEREGNGGEENMVAATVAVRLDAADSVDRHSARRMGSDDSHFPNPAVSDSGARGRRQATLRRMAATVAREPGHNLRDTRRVCAVDRVRYPDGVDDCVLEDRRKLRLSVARVLAKRAENCDRAAVRR